MKENNGIIIYQDEDGVTKVNVRFSNEDVWLTQNQLAEIYDTTQENISMHIKNIYEDKELDENRTYKKFLLVQFSSYLSSINLGKMIVNQIYFLISRPLKSTHLRDIARKQCPADFFNK